jgi:hypothetical protein
MTAGVRVRTRASWWSPRWHACLLELDKGKIFRIDYVFTSPVSVGVSMDNISCRDQGRPPLKGKASPDASRHILGRHLPQIHVGRVRQLEVHTGAPILELVSGSWDRSDLR